MQDAYVTACLIGVCAMSQYVLWRIRKVRRLIRDDKRLIRDDRAVIAQTRLDIARHRWTGQKIAQLLKFDEPDVYRHATLAYLEANPETPIWHIHDEHGKPVATLMRSDILQQLVMLIPVSEEATAVLSAHDHLEGE